MPRWVVIAEEVFEQLQNLQVASATSDHCAAPIVEPAVEAAVEPIVESVAESASIVESGAGPERPSSPPPTESVEASTSTAEEGGERWLEEIPPSFRRDAAALLQRLTTEPEFLISAEGNISLDGSDVGSIVQFLRTTSIPFHRGKIPLKLQDWLRDKNIVKFRNHLAKIYPKWQKIYDLRKRTTR